MFNIDEMPPSAPTGYFVNSFFPSDAYQMVVGNRDTVFLTHYSDLSRSTNGGISWSNSSFPYTSDLVVSPAFSHDRKAFAATTGSQNVIRLSSDGGQTWRASQAPLDVEVWDLFVSPTFTVDQTIYATIQNGLMRSVDGGEHWGSIAYPPSSCAIYNLTLSPYFANDQTLFAPSSYDCQQLWRSTDGGMTWQPVHNGLYIEYGNRLHSIAAIALGEGEIALIAATEWALLISFDFDGTWYVLGWDSIGQLYVPADFAWTGVMFAQNADCHLYRTRDFGETWQTITPNIAEEELYNIHIDLSPDYVTDHTLYVKARYTLWRSTDAGSAWSKQAENPPVYIQGIDHRSFGFSPAFESDGTVYAIPSSYYDVNWILKSTDAGRHWRAQFLPFTSNSMNQLAFSPQYATDRTIFMIFGPNLYRSTDAGENWTRIKGYNTIPLSEGSYPVSLVVSPNYAQDNTLFVGTSYDGIYRSTDGGNQWTLLKSFTSLQDFAVSPGYPQDPTQYAIFGEQYVLGLARSTDGGATWQNIPATFGNYFMPQIHLSPDFVNDGTLFVSVSPINGVHRSTDRGDHFTQVPGTEEASYFYISPRYPTDRTLVTSLGITEDDGEHWFPLEQSQRIGGIGYWENRLTMISFNPGDVNYADPYNGLYYYQWPDVQTPPSSIGFPIDPDAPAPVDVNLHLKTVDNRAVPWDVDGDAPWLTLSHITGTTPSTLTMTADPGGETITVGSMRTPITETFYLSYRLQQSYPISLKAFLVNARVYLPLTMRSYTTPAYTSSASHPPPMQRTEAISRLKPEALITFQKQE
ncbi:MAG: WD40/YVTN/BNR-like repeat-containing protein [Anaerolineae bacterium]